MVDIPFIVAKLWNSKVEKIRHAQPTHTLRLEFESGSYPLVRIDHRDVIIGRVIEGVHYLEFPIQLWRCCDGVVEKKRLSCS